MTHIFTKTGDIGTTSLLGGKRVSKASLRVAAYGQIDELNSSLGFARSLDMDKEISLYILKIQNWLFSLAADFAQDSSNELFRISGKETLELEEYMKNLESILPKQTCFLVPGGTQCASYLQVCRALCRRAERACWSLAEKENINKDGIVLLNRISDALFLMARMENHLKKVKEESFT